MQLLASDDNNTEFLGASNPDNILFVQFYERTMPDTIATQKEGRPIFKSVDFIKIMKPGDNTTEIDTYATDADKVRFPRQWALYQNNKTSEQIQGTDLREWPVIDRATAEGLRAQKFYTVEQIANASDQQSQALGMMGPRLKQQAQAYLLKAKDGAANQAQAKEIAELKAQVNQLMEVIAKTNAIANAPEPQKRKYNRKLKDAQQPEAA